MANQPQSASRTKILFLITKSNFGGAQRYVYDLATNMPTDQFAVTVALGGAGELQQRLIAAGVRVVSIPHLERDISLTKELLASRAIARLVRSEQPNILHLNSSKAGAIGALIGRITGVPCIIFTAHGWYFNENKPWLVRCIFKAAHWITVLLAHHTIAVSHALKAQMNWPGAARRMSVVHNGRALCPPRPRGAARAHLIECCPELFPWRADPWSISIGELHPVKQHDVAIAAMATLVERHPRLRHLIIGAGDARAALATAIETAGLAQHVYLLGNVPEAARYLSAADVFVLPSRSEALGYVVIEAAQAVLPIVASKVGGIPEVVTDGKSGTLVQSGEVSAFVEAIHTYLTDDAVAHAHGQAAKRKSQDFSIESMVRNTIAVYTSACYANNSGG